MNEYHDDALTMNESRFLQEKKMSNLWTFPLMTPLMTDQIESSVIKQINFKIFTSSKIDFLKSCD